MLLYFSLRNCAAGLAACGLLGVSALAQEPTQPGNPQLPGVTSEDQKPADVQDEQDDAAPAEPAPEVPPARDETTPDASPTPTPNATQPNAQPRPSTSNSDRARSDADPADSRAEARQDAREDRRDDARDRAGDRRDDRADRAGRRSSPDIDMTFNSTATGALVIDQIGPRYFRDAGFRRGDRIVTASGRRFNDSADFYVWLGTVAVGQRVPIIVLRDGRETTVYWTPTAEFVDMYAQQAPAGGVHVLGIHIDEQVDNAVVVARVDRDSSADRAGVAAGDVVVTINNQEVRSPREFADVVAAVAPNQAVQMAISRTFDVQLDPTAPGPVEARTSEPARPAPAVIERPASPPVVVPQSRVNDDYRYPRRGVLRRNR